MEFQKSVEITMPPDQVWPLLSDLALVCSCMQGTEITRQIDAQTCEGRISMGFASISLTFNGRMTLEQVDPAGRFVWIGTRGRERSKGGGFVMVTQMNLQPSASGSKLTVHSETKLTGSFAGYNNLGLLGIAGDHSGAQFVQNLKARLIWRASAPAGAKPPPLADKPLTATSLVGGMLRRAVTKRFGGS